jgi:hypothetical protein
MSGRIGICFGMGFVNPMDAEALRFATTSESDGLTVGLLSA